ncbi:MAG: aminotransferase class III-fold pyridoxal phosphate-dependent enzyme, partial [Holophagales bacterium]|nr:aminotransferase class III-fold pyridoxal phosphate-dependent enzyme [Holophagales bacterium]
GSTYGGNPLACAVGLAVIETLRRLDLPARAETMGARFADSLRNRFSSNPRVREIRGRGLMIGIVLRERAGRHIARLASEHRILALPAGPNVIRLLPPLIVTDEELERGVEAIQAVLGGQ